MRAAEEYLYTKREWDDNLKQTIFLFKDDALLMTPSNIQDLGKNAVLDLLRSDILIH